MTNESALDRLNRLREQQRQTQAGNAAPGQPEPPAAPPVRDEADGFDLPESEPETPPAQRAPEPTPAPPAPAPAPVDDGGPRGYDPAPDPAPAEETAQWGLDEFDFGNIDPFDSGNQPAASTEPGGSTVVTQETSAAENTPATPPKRGELVLFDDEDDILPDNYTPVTSTTRREVATNGVRGLINRMLGTSLMVDAEGPEFDPALLRDINRPLRYPQVIGVVGSKGGVGKSSTTQMLGSVLARHRKQGGVAALDLDANSSLIHLTQPTTPLSERARTSIHTLAHDDSVSSAADVNAHLVFNADGLAVLPGVAWSYHGPVTPEEFASALEKVARFYTTIIVDFPGSEEVPSAMAAMDMLDAIVYVAEVSPVAVNLAKPSLARINQTRPDLISSATVLLNHGTHPNLDSQVADIDRHVEKIEKLSASGNLRVMEVLHDPHLGEASRLELDRVAPYTHARFVEIAARVVSNLPGEQPRFMSHRPRR